MYFPYLRAKQYELKALREISDENNCKGKIVPILEPVKQDISALEIAIRSFVDKDFLFALILNPNDGDFRHSNVDFDILNKNEYLRNDKSKWIPAFIYSKSNVTDIDFIIKSYNLDHVMIIFRSCMDIDDQRAWDLVKKQSVCYVVNAFGTSISRRLKKQIIECGNYLIRLDDCFRSKTRNADYSIEDDELFSEEPFFYKTEGGFYGYSDFTTLPSEYVEGGMLPYALAIHISYKKNEEQLYVHHFVSDSNETNNDIRGKFRESAKKVAPFFANKPQTNAVKEIIVRADNPDGYPGLGYLKKLSIKNHLELILSL